MCGDCKVDPLQSAVMTLVTCRDILPCTLRTEPKGKYWKAVMSSRYPTPFFWEVLKRSFLHPSSLWATELYKQQDSIGATWIDVVYNELDPHELCVQSWLALFWGAAGISCPMFFLLRKSCDDVKKLIRCRRMRLHPKHEDTPCASTEDFLPSGWSCAKFLFLWM